MQLQILFNNINYHVPALYKTWYVNEMPGVNVVCLAQKVNESLPQINTPNECISRLQFYCPLQSDSYTHYL